MIRTSILLLSFILTESSATAQATAHLPPVVKQYKLLTINTAEIYEKISTSPLDATTRLTIGDHDLVLYKTQLLSTTYTLTDHTGKEVDNPKRAIPLKGHTTDGRPATITISDNFLMLSIDLLEDELWIEHASIITDHTDKNTYVQYLSSDVIADANATCAVTIKARHKPQQTQEIDARSTGTCLDVQYAIAHDYSMVQLLGSVADVESFGIAITNEVNDLYDNQLADVINFSIQGQFVTSCFGCDPWTVSTDVDVLLPDFRTWSQSNLVFAHDVATLWTNRDLSSASNGIGAAGFAYVGTVCTGDKYNICEHLSTNGLNKVIVSHEIGHNFNLNHVAGGLFIMGAISSPFHVNWSPASIANIDAYCAGLPNGCLDSPCQIGTPTISWQESSVVLDERSNSSLVAGPCNTTYSDYNLVLLRSNFSTDDIVVDITVNNASTTTSADFELLNPSVTFVSGGTLLEQVTVRIFDDAVAESMEEIVLDISITSGNATLGVTSTTTISINDGGDEISTSCCSQGALATFAPGTFFFTYSDFLYGDDTENRSRYLITAAQLTTAGLMPGPISQMELDVDTKLSTAAFEDLTIGLANYANDTLSTPWISTTEVFRQDYNTVEGWNPFAFNTPFVWDGTSGLYVEMCFSNSVVIGSDFLRCKSVQDFNGGYVTQVAGGGSLCDGSVTGNAIHTLVPVTRFQMGGGALIETATTAPVSSPLSVGDVAHFYSLAKNVIVTITNTGSTDLGCIDVSVHTAGTSSSSLAGTADLYSDKTIYVETDQPGSYDIGLHYTDAELSVWGSSANNLNMIKSTVAFASAAVGNLTAGPSTVTSFSGSENGSTYTSSFGGTGYYTISDRDLGPAPSTVLGNLVFATIGDGLILSSPSGTRYLIYESATDNLATVAVTTQTYTAGLLGSDLQIGNSGSIYFLPANTVGGYSQYGVTNSGSGFEYISSSPPTAPLVRLEAGHLQLIDAGSGLILSSPDGNCHMVTISDAGAIIVGPSPCP